MRPIAHKRIPTLLGLLLLVGTLSLTSYLVRGNLNMFSNAAPDTTPQHITVTNVTHDSFTVTYITTNPALGSVQYGVHAPTENLINDIRDASTAQNHTVHVIHVTSLSPGATYQFSILSNGNTYLNNGAPYHVTTRGVAIATHSYQAITGSISTPDQTPLGEALVVVTGDGLEPLSTVATNNGAYTLPLTNIPSLLTDDSKLQITIYTANGTGTVTTTYRQTRPVPLITLSQTFDFTTTTDLTSQQASSGGSLTSLSGSTPSRQIPQQPTIVSPYKNQRYTDPQPTFTGDALPNTSVSITIQSGDQITTSVIADRIGTWKYRPTKPLAPGTYTISISAKDAFTIVKTLQQTFTVLAFGSQIDANPSVAPIKGATPTTTPKPTVTKAPLATLTTKITLTPIPTMTSTPTPTTNAITPTVGLSPTVIPTATPTIMPTATIAPTATAVPTQIATGPTATPPPLEQFKTGSSMTVFAGILGGIMTLVGIGIFILSRGSSLL